MGFRRGNTLVQEVTIASTVSTNQDIQVILSNSKGVAISRLRYPFACMVFNLGLLFIKIARTILNFQRNPISLRNRISINVKILSS
ncbi:hypothetical protein PN36_01030 [Candidatus Thiomargarita nelsonii]|uniref:Uncharacterized protein n=1 Tax=Candidatus Thiomargarita nelsonii TaxID=1003181 RepID=A0A4E0QWV8_9GAMM|nr:hypothetical protein PN36_01030 [Candidatus Thiomargarita nelsonii]